MLFNSIEFAVFLPVVFLMYWLLVNNNLKLQNLFLLVASYLFYSWWDWRFLFLLISISLLNYILPLLIERAASVRKQKIWFTAGLILNIGTLVVFKYFNFFIEGFINLLALTGYNLPKASTSIILPLGISFYIFLSLSYLIDVYKGNIKANENIVDVLLSLGFFPIILAGPIHRPSSLLNQIGKKREFEYSRTVDGLKQIAWGLFVKIAIADNISSNVENIFTNFSVYKGSTLLVGIVLYSLQIYADFSGYSNIAIGIGKLLGFNLMRNFSYPYFSRDLTEFWKKWHISLTTWFRDYLFLPISFKVSWRIHTEKVFHIKTDLFIYIVASSITWLLTGLWHGANYTFIVWGLIHGFILILYQWQRKPRKVLFKKLSLSNDAFPVRFIETLFTLFVVMFAWIFFRSDSIRHAIGYIIGLFDKSIFSIPQVLPVKILFLSSVFLLAEWFQRDKEHALQIDGFKIKVLRWAIYYAVILLILLTFDNSQQGFIYSKF